jgi:hypothetical protein
MQQLQQLGARPNVDQLSGASVLQADRNMNDRKMAGTPANDAADLTKAPICISARDAFTAQK